MVVAVKLPSIMHQKFSSCDVDLVVVSFNSVPNLGCTLRVGELLIDSRCDIPLLEPSSFLLKMM